MSSQLKYIVPLALVFGCTAARAQWYNDTAVANAGGLISDWNSQAWNTANGSYSTAGSTGTPGNYGVFEHYGQTGTGNSSALRNDGVYNASLNGRDYFKGPNSIAGQQGIGGAVAPIFAELFLQNGAGQQFDITNANGVHIATSIAFANGITTTVRSAAATGSLRFRDNAGYSNTALGDAQYVNGYVTKIGDDPFTFPVGAQSGTDLRTLQIAAPATVTDALSIAYWNGSAAISDPSSSGTQSLTALNPAGAAGVDQLISVSPLCFWDWIALSGTSSVAVTVSLPSFSGNGGYASAVGMRLVGWNTGTQQWDNLSGNTGATGLTEGSTLTGTVSNMANYSAIAVGNVLTTPLPVDILSFYGHIDNQCTAHLAWTTAHEKNTAQFTVQYSHDGSSYLDAGTVKARNTASGNSYTYEMANVAAGKILYRLQIADADGSTAYYKEILSLQSYCSPAARLKIWPNPARDNVAITGLEPNSNIRLFDLSGRLLTHIAAAGHNAVLDIKSYKAGMCLLSITVNDIEVARQKIVKQ